MHIGLIGGIGPAATEFYYRGLIDRHAAAGTCPELTIVHADVRDMVRNLAARDPKAQAEIFARLVQRLQAAGAEAAAVTSMGGHFCIEELAAISPLPLINGLPAVPAELARRGVKSIGVMGTRLVMETGLYGRLAPFRVVLPEGEALQKVHETYGAMASAGRITAAQRGFFHLMGRRLIERGAEAVLLSGTDLFLAFQGEDPGYPVIDCADIHVEAIYRRSLGRA
jgi:aspartate racemase